MVQKQAGQSNAPGISQALEWRLSRRGFIGSMAASAVVPGMLAAFLEACGNGTSTGSSVKNLVVAMSQGSLRTLDPNNAYEPEWFTVGMLCYQQLVTFAGSDLSHVVPSLASSWTVSSDGLTYTFTLDSKAKFWDGSAVTADDVIFSLERFINLKGPGSFLLDGVTGVQSAGNQVTLTLQSLNVDLLNILTSPSLSIGKASAIKANGGTSASGADKSDTARPWLDQHSVGSGPYVLDSWVRGSQLVVKANKNYWKSAPAVPQVTFKFVTDPTTQRDLLERGDAHIALNLTPDLATGLKGVKDVSVKNVPTLAFAYLALNIVNNPALNKAQAWDAIRYAIDYSGLKSIYGDGGTPVASCVPTGMGGSLPASESITQDLTKAKAALAAAGLANGFSFKLTYPSDANLINVPTAIVAQKLHSDLAQVGITAELNPMLISDLVAPFRAGKLESVLLFWTADYAGWTDFEPVFAAGGAVAGKRLGWTATFDSNAQQIAALTAKASSTVDQSQQFQYVQQALRLMKQSCPYGWLFQPTLQFGYRTDVIKDITGNAVWDFDLPNIQIA